MKSNKSFIRTCLIINAIYFAMIFAIYLIITTIANYRLEMNFPTIYNLLQYEDVLISEEFSRIPLSRLKNCTIIIFDENKKVIYSTDKDIEEEIKTVNFDYINAYENNEFYRVFDMLKKDGSNEYYIMKIRTNDEDDGENLEEFAVLNKNLEVIRGGLFGEKTSLSELELKLIRGKFNEFDIEKYNYLNIDDEERTVIFIEPEFNIDNYEKIVSDTNKIWLIAIPGILAIIFIQMTIYKKKLIKSIEPINEIISLYENKKTEEIKTEDIPVEFQPLAINFKMLLDKIEKNKEDKNRMIANISHDLKTPLTAIQGYSQAFKDRIVPDDKKEQYINAIYNKTIVATDLINKLFEYTKLEHPKYNLKLEEINIVEFTNNYIIQKQGEPEFRDYKIDVNIPDKEILCEIDKDLFTRLYDNLLNNSIKHNEVGTKIIFKIHKNQDRVKISIADNGKGISNKIKDIIFEPFVTGSEARTIGEGTGLGMSIVKTIVDLHGGKIVFNENNIINGYTTQFDIEINIKE